MGSLSSTAKQGGRMRRPFFYFTGCHRHRECFSRCWRGWPTATTWLRLTIRATATATGQIRRGSTIPLTASLRSCATLRWLLACRATRFTCKTTVDRLAFVLPWPTQSGCKRSSYKMRWPITKAWVRTGYRRSGSPWDSIRAEVWLRSRGDRARTRRRRAREETGSERVHR